MMHMSATEGAVRIARASETHTRSAGRVSLARENEAGGRKSIFSMLTYRTLFFSCNNRTVPK